MKAARHGFSLLEVVMAIGILALAVIALLGFIAASANTDGDLADARAAAGLGGPIQAELERLRAELGLDGLAAAVPPAGSPAPLQLVATRDGRRVLRADGAGAAADRPLDDSALPGIARRDRYFAIAVTRQLDLPDAPDAGFLAVSALVRWPFNLPVGPAAPGAVAVDADGAREAPAEARSWLVLNLAVTP
jgi:hypothetical protein